MERDTRDPGALGNALFALRGIKTDRRMSQIADDVDRGVLGLTLINYAFLNGRSGERLKEVPRLL